MRCGFQRDGAAHRTCVPCINGKIEYNQFDLTWINEGAPKARSKHCFDLHTPAQRTLQEIAHVPERIVEIDRFGIEMLATRKCEQLRRELRPALCRNPHVGKALF